MAEEKDRIIAGTFQCQMQVTQQRSIVITGHVYSDDTAEEINVRLDRFQDALDRQFIRCDLVNKEAQRANVMAHIEDVRDQLEKLVAKQNSSNNGVEDKRPKLTAQEKETIRKGDEQVRNMQTGVIKMDAMIAEARKKLAPQSPA